MIYENMLILYFENRFHTLSRIRSRQDDITGKVNFPTLAYDEGINFTGAHEKEGGTTFVGARKKWQIRYIYVYHTQLGRKCRG